MRVPLAAKYQGLLLRYSHESQRAQKPELRLTCALELGGSLSELNPTLILELQAHVLQPAGLWSSLNSGAWGRNPAPGLPRHLSPDGSSRCWRSLAVVPSKRLLRGARPAQACRLQS